MPRDNHRWRAEAFHATKCGDDTFGDGLVRTLLGSTRDVRHRNSRPLGLDGAGLHDDNVDAEGDVDDAAAARSTHHRQHATRQIGEAEEVDLELVARLFEGMSSTAP
jgi:hypothetical protein